MGNVKSTTTTTRIVTTTTTRKRKGGTTAADADSLLTTTQAVSISSTHSPNQIEELKQRHRTDFQRWVELHGGQPTREEQLQLAKHLYDQAFGTEEEEDDDDDLSTLSTSSPSYCNSSTCSSASSSPVALTTTTAETLPESNEKTETATATALVPQHQLDPQQQGGETSASKCNNNEMSNSTSTTTSATNTIDARNSSIVSLHAVRFEWFLHIFCNSPYLQRLREFGCEMWFIQQVAMLELLRRVSAESCDDDGDEGEEDEEDETTSFETTRNSSSRNRNNLSGPVINHIGRMQDVWNLDDEDYPEDHTGVLSSHPCCIGYPSSCFCIKEKRSITKKEARQRRRALRRKRRNAAKSIRASVKKAWDWILAKPAIVQDRPTAIVSYTPGYTLDYLVQVMASWFDPNDYLWMDFLCVDLLAFTTTATAAAAAATTTNNNNNNNNNQSKNAHEQQPHSVVVGNANENTDPAWSRIRKQQQHQQYCHSWTLYKSIQHQ